MGMIHDILKTVCRQGRDAAIMGEDLPRQENRHRRRMLQAAVDKVEGIDDQCSVGGDDSDSCDVVCTVEGDGCPQPPQSPDQLLTPQGPQCHLRLTIPRKRRLSPLLHLADEGINRSDDTVWARRRIDGNPGRSGFSEPADFSAEFGIDRLFPQ